MPAAISKIALVFSSGRSVPTQKSENRHFINQRMRLLCSNALLEDSVFWNMLVAFLTLLPGPPLSEACMHYLRKGSRLQDSTGLSNGALSLLWTSRGYSSLPLQSNKI